MQRTAVPQTVDNQLWAVIRRGTSELGWDSYSRAMDAVLRRIDLSNGMRHPPFTDAYLFLKDATESFVATPSPGSAPPLVELIWSYWHEAGMLAQCMAAIALRFQNVRGGPSNPLASMDIDPLRPLGSLLWGYVQDEPYRLTAARRAYEYDHQYGLRLHGNALPEIRSADSRTQFLDTFHNVLALALQYYEEDDDTSVFADAVPLLDALKALHLVLSEGAHNQFAYLAATARAEMLVQQWLLARPELRDVLPVRQMVAYPEPWMGPVDAIKRLLGWSDTSVLHFHNLGVYGEPMLLSIRFGAWSEIDDPEQAANWARYWRAEVERYVDAYRAVGGVDLTAGHVLPAS